MPLGGKAGPLPSIPTPCCTLAPPFHTHTSQGLNEHGSIPKGILEASLRQTRASHGYIFQIISKNRRLIFPVPPDTDTIGSIFSVALLSSTVLLDHLVLATAPGCELLRILFLIIHIIFVVGSSRNN